MLSPTTPSLAVFFTVWNRGDLFAASFASLLDCLEGVNADIWVFDNGSSAETRALLEGLSAGRHSLFKMSLPRNMGIPYALNVFAQAVQQKSTFAQHDTPPYVAIFDGDMYFREPLRRLLAILTDQPGVAVVSGHDSIEHLASSEQVLRSEGCDLVVKTKSVERGCYLLLRTGFLQELLPFPHDVPYNIDWQIMQCNPRSLARTGRTLLCVDASVHLGLFDSTWLPEGVPASREQVAEILEVLHDRNLMTSSRTLRARSYVERHGMIELMDEPGGIGLGAGAAIDALATGPALHVPGAPSLE